LGGGATGRASQGVGTAGGQYGGGGSGGYRNPCEVGGGPAGGTGASGVVIVEY
jgi:hypothetical protein